MPSYCQMPSNLTHGYHGVKFCRGSKLAWVQISLDRSLNWWFGTINTCDVMPTYFRMPSKYSLDQGSLANARATVHASISESKSKKGNLDSYVACKKRKKIYIHNFVFDIGRCCSKSFFLSNKFFIDRIIIGDFFPYCPELPWAAHNAQNWKSMSEIRLRHPPLYLLCGFYTLMQKFKTHSLQKK